MNSGRKQTRLVQNWIGTTALGVPCSICFKFVVVAPVLALLFRNILFCMSSAINLVCTPHWCGGARGLVCSSSFTALFCWHSEGKPSNPPLSPLPCSFPSAGCVVSGRRCLYAYLWCFVKQTDIYCLMPYLCNRTVYAWRLSVIQLLILNICIYIDTGFLKRYFGKCQEKYLCVSLHYTLVTVKLRVENTFLQN